MADSEADQEKDGEKQSPEKPAEEQESQKQTTEVEEPDRKEDPAVVESVEQEKDEKQQPEGEEEPAPLVQAPSGDLPESVKDEEDELDVKVKEIEPGSTSDEFSDDEEVLLPESFLHSGSSLSTAFQTQIQEDLVEGEFAYEEGDEETGVEEELAAPEQELLGEAEEDEEGTSTTSMSEVYSKLSPFFLKWAYGVKTSTKMINLTKGNQFEVFYAASHFGIIYDYRRNSMRFLPGHNSLISSIAADASGRWLVTADDGDDNVIIIWDHERRVPCWCLYNVFSNGGATCVQISQDSRFLLAVGSDTTQVCKFFLWTFGREKPDGIVELDAANGIATNLQFNHLDTTQFAITTEMNVVFCQWQPEKKSVESYTLGLKKRKAKVGTFAETIFLDDNRTAITSTNTGHVVVWRRGMTDEAGDTAVAKQKKYEKTVKIHRSGITSLQLTDQVIVSSSEDGVVSFHDQSLGLLYWVPKYIVDPVVCVSCNLQPQRVDQMDPFSEGFNDLLNTKRSSSEEDVVDLVHDDGWDEPEKGTRPSDDGKAVEFADDAKKQRMIVPSDCTIDMKPFYMRDFIFLTTNGRFGYVSHHRTKVKYFLYHHESPVLAIDCNPNKALLAVGNSNGRIDLYNHKQQKLLVSNQIAKTAIVTLKHSPKGRYLLAGLRNGHILILDPMILTVKLTITLCRNEIGKICFTSNERIFAFYDKESTVYVYKLVQPEKTKTKKWVFMGGYRSHYKPIRDIMFDEVFDESNKERVPRLFTIGEDRMLVEYDIKTMQPGNIRLKSIDRIEQTAIPQCFTLLPMFGKKVCFMVANNEYKFKVINRESRICVKTTLGPTADSPVNFLFIIPGWEREKKTAKMIYVTDRNIGLRLLPATGNPYEGMGLVGHPVKILSMAISHDFKHVFTIGVNDCSILAWKVNYQSADIAHQLGGTGLEPFMTLIEGGSDGFLFKEMQDFFYYSQIIHQGEHANLDRSVTKSLALCEIPDLVRSLGYYPTDYEVENIMYEVRHLEYEETGELVNEISFEECVKIYLNHRPMNGISLESVNKALLAIADLSDPECIIVEKEELYKALEERAEAMSHEEVLGYLCILLLPKDEKEPLPGTMTLKDFADDVLGIDLNITEENVQEVTHPSDNKNKPDD